jgi:hypothetical protein
MFCFSFKSTTRDARFFLLQHTKAEKYTKLAKTYQIAKNMPISHKMYQMAKKYTK